MTVLFLPAYTIHYVVTEKVETQSFAINAFFNDDILSVPMNLQKKCFEYHRKGLEKLFKYLIIFYRQLKNMMTDMYLLQPAYTRVMLKPLPTTWSVVHSMNLFCRNLPYIWDQKSSHIQQLSNNAIGDSYAAIDTRVFSFWTERKKETMKNQCPNKNSTPKNENSDMCSRCQSGVGLISSDEVFFLILLIVSVVLVPISFHRKKDFPFWVKYVSDPGVSFMLSVLLSGLVIMYIRTVLFYFISKVV